MPILSSEESENPLSICLEAGQLSLSRENGSWQHIKLILTAPQTSLSLGGPGQACLLCRSPQDEIMLLIEQIEELLNGSRTSLYFEPAEPSFELTLAKTPLGGISVHCFWDAGNATTGFYRWDALGIRFYTTTAQLGDFLRQLRQEFLD